MFTSKSRSQELVWSKFHITNNRRRTKEKIKTLAAVTIMNLLLDLNAILLANSLHVNLEKFCKVILCKITWTGKGLTVKNKIK